MRFEVNVDDGSNLDTLHKARDAYNAANAATPGFVPADDMPTFVQRLMDKAAADAMTPFGVATFSAALTRIAELESSNATLAQEVAATQLAIKAAPLN